MAGGHRRRRLLGDQGATATLAWLLAQRGELDFDAPVTAYWPEFAGGGKANMPVRYLFTHLVGLRVCLTQC